jgi:hypothetical protein
MRPAGIFASKTKQCLTKTAAYEKGNNRMTAGTYGQLNKQFFYNQKQTVQQGQNFQNKQFNFSKQFDFKQLKLKKMKKQILIFAMFTLALIFAGTNMSFGQVVYHDFVEGTPLCTPAIALPATCATASGHLNPTPGQIYNYSITTSPELVSNVLWFVTDASAVITAGGLTGTRDPGDGTGDYILLAEAAVYNVTTNTTKDIDISWQWFDGTANEVLLVAYVKGASGCSDNLEVWRIEPTFSFTLDVAALLDNGTFGDEECVSPVESATYNGTSLVMDYGENWVFFSVNAANFAHSWMPEIGAVITGTSTIGAVQWAYPDQAVLNDGAGNATGTWNATTIPILASAAATGGVVGGAGECIVVRVEIQHDNNPTPLAANTEIVTLSIDGIMYDAANLIYTNSLLADVDVDPDDPNSCVQDYTDTADYTLLARPEITSTTPAVPGPGSIPFVPKN